MYNGPANTGSEPLQQHRGNHPSNEEVQNVEDSADAFSREVLAISSSFGFRDSGSGGDVDLSSGSTKWRSSNRASKAKGRNNETSSVLSGDSSAMSSALSSMRHNRDSGYGYPTISSRQGDEDANVQNAAAAVLTRLKELLQSDSVSLSAILQGDGDAEAYSAAIEALAGLRGGHDNIDSGSIENAKVVEDPGMASSRLSELHGKTGTDSNFGPTNTVQPHSGLSLAEFYTGPADGFPESGRNIVWNPSSNNHGRSAFHLLGNSDTQHNAMNTNSHAEAGLRRRHLLPRHSGPLPPPAEYVFPPDYNNLNAPTSDVRPGPETHLRTLATQPFDQTTIALRQLIARNLVDSPASRDFIGQLRTYQTAAERGILQNDPQSRAQYLELLEEQVAPLRCAGEGEKRVEEEAPVEQSFDQIIHRIRQLVNRGVADTPASRYFVSQLAIYQDAAQRGILQDDRESQEQYLELLQEASVGLCYAGLGERCVRQDGGGGVRDGDANDNEEGWQGAGGWGSEPGRRPPQG